MSEPCEQDYWDANKAIQSIILPGIGSAEIDVRINIGARLIHENLCAIEDSNKE